MAYKSTCKTLAKVADDEPIFVLRAQDELAPQVISFWASLAYNKGVNHKKVMEADHCATKMKEWKNRKLPD